ncbi:cell wall-binding repeat-containing protein [Desulfosporosinus lacus]|uniref:Putative cell wall-binding protein n=1 Tax=Desulfosporosinus lacus DSM 15449 TaxID=1121420 RepID=A0A1M5RGA7_9FIRM|nr:cell wall-binding repeat-containing protein [Desulfosporosinus lacus]SHH24803.1 Putative cell wall-binding protein [Desulfosporosinus lacus DSM 15449]
MKISLKHYWASAELSLNLGQFTENALAILFAMVAFLVFLPGTVFAANYTVTNYSDSGAGSLRSAIEQSNSATGPNTIIVPTGTYTLSSGPLEILNHVTIIGANGDLEGDAAKTIIQASDSVDTANTRVFDINPLQDATGYNVALKALTIRNGNVGAGSPYGGAGIAADTGISTVTIYNCIVENNKSSYEGAGLHISGLAGGTFHMEKTVVHNNTAVGPGGGIFLEGDLNAAISLSSILNNASLSSQGGGMSIRPYIAAGIITITSSTITGNSAAGTDVGQGGGIYLNSPAAITDTMISGNVSDLDGGGVYYANYGPGTLTLSNTIFDNNSTIQLGRTKDLYIHTGEYVNAAPIITSPGSILVTEDVACPLTGISFSDIDSGSAAVTATFNVSGGALSATSGGGVTITGAGTGTLTLTGTVSDISAFIATGQIAFTTAANSTESVTLTIGINDGGKTGSGGAKTDSSTVTLTVTAVNDVPIVTASSDISVTENLPSPLTGISFSDVDAGSNGSETMTLSVPSGTLSAISSGGVTVTGAGTGTLTLTGTVSDINAFIAAGQIAFTTAANSTESVTLTIGVNDGGNTGSGGALTASKTVTLTVTAVNNAPTAKSVVPTQSITGTGTVSFTASDIAEDVDSGDILTITDIMTAPESAKAKAVLLSGTVTVTGVASGSTSVVVRASDGNASVNVTVPITVAPPTAYALTITAGTGGAITTGSSGNYPEGSVVSISATATSDYKFYRWTAVGGGTFADSSSASTSFTMPAANVTVMAEFEAIPPTPTSPVISSITPSSGPESGGITVTINGSGFTGATVVNFGTALGTNLTVISDTSITVTSPAGTGTIDVTVTTPDGTSAKNLSDEFTYTSASTSLISITTPSAITGVANGTEKTAAALGLPLSVVLVTGQGNVSANISWDVNASSYDVTTTTEQTFSVSGTVSLPAGVVNPNSVALTTTISVTVNAATTVDKTLMSIAAPSDIVGVANGTAKTAVALGLTTSVILVTDHGSVNANVSWDVNASTYDVAATTEQTFSVTGTVSLPAGVVNPSSIALTTTINVTVDAATTTDKTLISITPLSAITGVANGTAKTALALGLPSNVVLVTDNGNVNANVSWDVNTSSYVVTRTTEQTFSVTGTVSLPAGVVNPNSVALTTTISVTVNAATSSGGDSGGSSGGSSGSTTTVTGDVTDSKTGQIVRDIEARVTAGKDGKKTIEINSKEAIVFQQPNSTHSSVVDLSKLGFSSTTNPDSEITLTADGILQIKNLANGTDSNFTVTYDLGNGQRITIGTIEAKVGSDGKVSLSITLIDPYGIITDPTTGQPIVGVDVTLYYANTERNFRTGKTPDTMVQLPILDGFKPNNNKNPQVSDASGAYGFMVFPTSDYYIVATKEGYEAYKSPTISVEQDIVKWDFKMNQSITGVKRLAGLTSVDTALEIAKANYTTKLSNVVLATAENYPDALAGSVLAYKLNAPILLVGNTEVDQEKIIAYLKSNLEGKGTVYILGGTAVVSAEMEAKVMASGFNQIIRLGGTDRYETAVKIADQLEVQSGTPIVLVYGENYPDALSISSIAAGMQSPILLVQKEGLSKAVQETIAEIKPIKVYIIGGEGVISTAAENQVAQITSLDRTNIVRISGEDRYETSLAVAQYFNLSGQSVCIATGKNFPDALAGSVYAANFNAPIILAEDSLSDQVINFLETRTMTGVTLFGGEAVISKDIEQQLRQLLGK